MKGWTTAGQEIELTADQENAVRLFLAWDRGASVHLVLWGRGQGKSTVIATVARYAAARARGNPLLDDDPLLDPIRERT